jgi:hypothetical protein
VKRSSGWSREVLREVAKTKTKTIREMEQSLSPEGLKLAKKSARAIWAVTGTSREVNNSPEGATIHELVGAYLERKGKTKERR